TISPKTISGVLREQMGFKNLILTDALEMRGLTNLYPPGHGNPAGRAAVDAVKAGNDVILLPTDLDGAFRGLVDAVKKGEIPQSRIDASVKKILETKASLALHKARLVDLEQVPYLVSKQEDVQFAQQVADDSVTLVRDNGKTLPLPKLRTAPAESDGLQAPAKPSAQLVAIIITDSVVGFWGRGFEHALKTRRPDAAVFYVDNNLAAPLAPLILQSVK